MSMFIFKNKWKLDHSEYKKILKIHNLIIFYYPPILRQNETKNKNNIFLNF
jgi:hypothetical protein